MFQTVYHVGGLLFITLVVNFICAVALKNILRESLIEQKWILKLMIIPPFAITAWVVTIIMGLWSELKKIIRDYFKD